MLHSNVFDFLIIFAIEILGFVLYAVRDYCHLYRLYIPLLFCMLEDVYVYLYKGLGFYWGFSFMVREVGLGLFCD